MHSNTSSVLLLKLETLGLSDVYIYPAFVFGILTYVCIMFCNLLLLTTIVWSKSLHKPMFILLINLHMSDMVGATAFFPQFVLSIVTQNRQISYPACVFQAFLVHVYGTGNLLFLSAMAYDRYAAVCCPLRYNGIMTPVNLMRIIFLLWFINVSTITSLLIVTARYSVCRTKIVDLFCNNPSLMKLACEDTTMINYVGLLSIAVFQGGPMIIIIFTYGQILRTCVMTNNPEAWRKAFQTCSTHLAIYLLLVTNSLFSLIAHRLQNASSFLRRAFGLSILIFPPLLDPIIYGLKTKELKENIKLILKRNANSLKL